MKVSSRKHAIAVVAATVAVGSGVGVGVATVGAQAEPPVILTEDAGVLRIHLAGGGASVSYSGPLDVPPSQSVTVTSKCEFTSSGPLLQFSASGGPQGLGLVSNGLGVRQKNSCATDSGQASGTAERINLALGSAFGDGISVDVAELDIQGKHSADLGAALDGGPVVTHQLSNSSDNGPDSGASDNDRVIINDDFVAVTLSAVGGEVSLEGGGDASYTSYLNAGAVGPIGTSLGTADTILKLVSVQDFDHALDCEESIEATLIGGSATYAVFNRGLNDGATTPEDCEDIGVTLEILDEGVLLAKSTTGLETGAEQEVNAEIDIVWTPQAAAVPLPARLINFDGDPDGVFEAVQWCEEFDPETGWVHPADPRFEDGVVPWCLIDEDNELLDDGTVRQTQSYDGKGDPMWR